MTKLLAALSLTLGLAACAQPNHGYGNNGYGNRDWDRYHHTVSHPIAGSNQIAEIR